MNRRYFTIIIIIALPILLTIYFFRGDQEEQPESEEISLSINRIHQKGKAQDNSPDNSAGQQLDYEIQAGVKVAGRLLHSDGNYFGGGKVLAVRAKGRRNLTIVTANARGRFRFKSLPPELIIFKVTSSTFPRPVELPVELQEGKDMDDLELVVPRGKASLKGVVVDPDNMPMSGVTIYLSSQNGYKVYEQSLVSDDHGNLFFQELWPGEYALSFEKKGYREYKLIRRTSKNSFRVVLTPLYQISGEVHDLNDKPSTYFTVKVIGRGEYNRSLSKNFRVKNGKFAVNVEAGRFDLLV